MPSITGCVILIILFGIGAYGSTSIMMKPPIEIQKSEMTDELQRDALQFAFLAFNIYDNDNDIATYIVKEFDRRHGGTWQCIVGNYGGYFVQHKWNSYIHFSFGDKGITIFRTA